MPVRAVAEKPVSWTRQWRRARQILSEALVSFWSSDSLTISASIAYHSLLSIFPLLLLLLGLSALLIRHYEITWQLTMVLERALPMKPDFIMRNLVGISQAYGRVSVVSFFLLLWSSSGVFLPLEKALNRAWEVDRERTWSRRRILALEMALILGCLVFVSSVLVGVNAYIHHSMRRWALHSSSAGVDFVYHALLLVITFTMTLAMFVILFKRLPNRRLGFRQVFPSALLTAIFWEAARSLFTMLLPLFNYRQVYGSIGVVVALMTWAYFSSAVTLFGAEVSRSLYRTLKLPGPMETLPPLAASTADAR